MATEHTPRLRYAAWLWRYRLHIVGSHLRRGMKKSWNRLFPGVPVLIRLSPGFWWKAAGDVVGDGVFDGSFERAERRFLTSFLRPGMLVLDVGAHHGLYTLLCARAVRPSGRVIAFEPSSRERLGLQDHLSLNRVGNVEVAPIAVGSSRGRKELVLAPDGGYNTLAQGPEASAHERVEVEVDSLDEYLADRSLARVDLVKIDVEGGEMEVLKGASSLLEQLPRPLLMCEVDDTRTAPWGYEAREIVRYLQSRNFRWYRPIQAGGLRPIDPELHPLGSNFIAVPAERVTEISTLIRGAEY